MAESPDTLSVLRASAISVFANPDAHGGSARSRIAFVQDWFHSMKIPMRVEVPANAGELESAARAAITCGQSILFAMGGDGTFQALANASFGSGVQLGILPAGGGNDFAASLGIPSDLPAVLRGLSRYVPRSVDLLRAQTADGKTRLYVGGGGLGLDSEAARYASGVYRRLPGRLRYIAAALRALGEHVPLRVRIEFPGTDLSSVESSCLLASALNTPTYGGGVRLGPGAQMDDGILSVVLVEPLGTLSVLGLLPRLLGSGELRTERIRRWQAKRVCFATDRPCFFHGDGEILGPAPVQVEVVPRAVQVLAPSDT